MSKTTKALAILGVVAGLGVAAMPMGAMAASPNGTSSSPATDDLTINATVTDFISIEITAGATGADHAHVLALDNVTPNGDIVSGEVTVNLKTNSTKGYELGISAPNNDGKLVDSDNNDGTTNFIAGGKPDQGTSAWGFQINKTSSTAGSVDTYEDEYSAVPTTNTPIASGKVATTAVATGVNSVVKFGVSAGPNQVAGTYSGTVVFTASVKTQ